MLDDNAKTDYQARELKTIQTNCRGNFLRLVVHKPHENRVNLFSQVSGPRKRCERQESCKALTEKS
eukprot:10593614-Prorocentrum_lima.AAC.1